MPLCGLHAGVPPQNGHLVDWNARQQEFDGKGVPEHVRMGPLIEFGPLEEPLQAGVPTVAGAIM